MCCECFDEDECGVCWCCTTGSTAAAELRREAACYVAFVLFLILFPAVMANVMLYMDPLAHPTKSVELRTGRPVQHLPVRGPDGKVYYQPKKWPVRIRNVTVVAIGEGSWSSVSPEVRSVRKSNLEYSLQFSFLIMMTIISYLKGHMTDPGGARDWKRMRPDLQYPRDDEAGVDEGDDVENQNVLQAMISQSSPNEEVPRCTKCNHIKPPRVYHCSYCQRCVLRMDHHCPWLGNCVGHKNMKFFLLFLIYVELSTGYYTFIFIRFFTHMHRGPKLHSNAIVALSVSLPFSSMIAFITFVGVFGLMSYTLYLAALNKTQVESMKEKARTDTVSYNRGIINNFRHILGKNPLLWLVPVGLVREPKARHLKV
mmetsp:Transcript_8969/g.39609  ORF Transcript_8969/g.39609 Transcript_8969/m.39609 type:complete len:369 (-) Transcript_8969:663-1769(-)